MDPYIMPPVFNQAPGDLPVIGITTTVPAEIIYAAGFLPLDINNLFISSPEPEDFIRKAEKSGFPRTCCSWTKGIYGAVKTCGIEKIVIVVQGDCSNTHALAEILGYEGVECIPFAFPYRPDQRDMAEELRRLSGRLDNKGDNELWRLKLRGIRSLAHEIDRLTWQERKVYGIENHLWLISTSDFCSAPDAYELEARRFLEIAGARKPLEGRVRLGMAGVPPIVPEIYEFAESRGGHIVYNETQRQFSMPLGGQNLPEQYSRYTYPYGIQNRLRDIRAETERRKLDGLIHYVQSFCYHRIEDRMLRDAVGVPLITIEQDRPGPLSGQLKTRLEAFIEILEAGGTGRSIF